MLLLGRNLGESIVIADNIYIKFVETDKSGQKFKLDRKSTRLNSSHR